jgi:hypothetical protein
MFRNIAIITGSALVASVALAGPAPAAGYDVTAARNELKAAAALTRAEAVGGFSTTGSIATYSEGTLDSVVDSDGRARMVEVVDPAGEKVTNYASLGVGYWRYLSSAWLKRNAAGLAYIDKPNAHHVFWPDNSDLSVAAQLPESGADYVETLERNDLSDLVVHSADKVDDGNGHIIYTFSATTGEPHFPTTITATLTDGLVTQYSSRVVVPGERTRAYDRSWEYGPQEPVVVPTVDRYLTQTEQYLLPSAVVLAQTVKRHARQTAAEAKAIAKKAHRKKVWVRDVRTAATRVLDKYVESGDYPEDAVPTRATNLTGGVALHATDPYKNKVRIAVVQAIKGKVVVSS